MSKKTTVLGSSDAVKLLGEGEFFTFSPTYPFEVFYNLILRNKPRYFL